MLIIQPATDDIIPDLVQEMLNIERGNRYGQNWPVVVIPPKTKAGSQTTIHYKSTVGVVYFTSSAFGKSSHFTVPEIVHNVFKEISQHTDHLMGYRAVSASTTAITRHTNRINRETIICGPSSKAIKLTMDPLEMPARILKWSFETEAPVHFSKGCAFTWYFIPIETCIDMPPVSSENVNALISSVLIDNHKLTKFKHGDIVMKLNYSDFKIADNLQIKRMPIEGVLLADSRKKRLTYVGNPNYLQLPKAPDTLQTMIIRDMTETHCLSCNVPFADTAIYMDICKVNANTSMGHTHRSITNFIGKSSIKIFLCEFCWNSINKSCLNAFEFKKHFRVKIKTPQSDLIDKTLGINGISKCIDRKFRILYDGVFVVDAASTTADAVGTTADAAGTTADAAGTTADATVDTTTASTDDLVGTIILTAEKWGKYPMIELSEVLAEFTTATIIPNVKLASISYE